MAFEIIWTKQAAKGFDNIINYILQNWTEKELRNFIAEADNFFNILATHPEILQKTSQRKNVYRGPINPLTIVTYRIKPRSKKIQLLNIRGARQKPVK